MNLQELKTIINDSLMIREDPSNNGGLIFLPFVIPGYNEWLGVYVKFDEQGIPSFNDCKYIYNYYDEMGIEANAYIDEINSIINHFEIRLEDEHFVFNCISNQKNHIKRCLCNFLQALTLLAFIENFKILEK